MSRPTRDSTVNGNTLGSGSYIRPELFEIKKMSITLRPVSTAQSPASYIIVIPPAACKKNRFRNLGNFIKKTILLEFYNHNL